NRLKDFAMPDGKQPPPTCVSSGKRPRLKEVSDYTIAGVELSVQPRQLRLYHCSPWKHGCPVKIFWTRSMALIPLGSGRFADDRTRDGGSTPCAIRIAYFMDFCSICRGMNSTAWSPRTTPIRGFAS